jgi:alpha-tubulin suppressor-like RCC1 family protein
MKKRRAKSVSVRVSANSPTFSSRGIVLTPRSTTVNETTDLSPRQKIVQFRPKAPPTPPPKKQTKILPALQHRSHFELLRTSSLPKPLTSRSSEKKFTVVASPHAVFSKITRKEKAKKIEKISHMCIFSAGDNTFSRLGIGTKLKQDINNIKVPLGQIEFAACGWDHTVIIVGDSVAVCGRASHGQLGNGVTDDLAQLEVVHHIEVTGKKFRSMACGAYYTMLVTEENVLLAAGDNSSGQLGIGNRQKRLSFYRVEFSLPIREVVCGHAHTGIVTSK